MSRDFLLLVFFSRISFPQAPDYTIRAGFKFFQKFAEIFAAQGLPPVSTTPVANGKNLQPENCLHLRVVKLAYRKKFFEFSLGCQQFDNCSHFVDTGGNLPPAF